MEETGLNMSVSSPNNTQNNDAEIASESVTRPDNAHSTGAVIGIIVGAIAALAMAIVGNIIVTPFYAHMTTAQVVALIVPALLPFNALKFTIHGVVTFLIYKPISNLLNR